MLFNEGKYDPQSDSGKHLLAHELIISSTGSFAQNTVQQSTKFKRNPLKNPQKPSAYDGDRFGKAKVIARLEGLRSKSKEKSYDVSVKIGGEYLERSV